MADGGRSPERRGSSAVTGSARAWDDPLHFESPADFRAWLEAHHDDTGALHRTVVRSGGAELSAALRDEGFGVTEMIGRGREGNVEVLYSVIPRRNVPRCLSLIDRGAPESFVVVDEPRLVRRGWPFPRRKK